MTTRRELQDVLWDASVALVAMQRLGSVVPAEVRDPLQRLHDTTFAIEYDRDPDLLTLDRLTYQSVKPFIGLVKS